MISDKKHIRLFRNSLLRWFARHGRKHLPWQQNPTPYRVWISEIMLQQTQVTTVIPYFERFMARFPSITALANASEDEVLHLWTGLGYYSRARNLLKAAQIIVQQFRSQFPDNLADMQLLPGIGRSTAAAIFALAMQKQAAILDGNVKRVLSRMHMINPWQDETRLWKIAETYTPKKHVAAYTQAMMDLGAMICIRNRPLCLICPVQKTCLAYQKQRQADFPGKKSRKTLPVRTIQLIILHDTQGRILLEKRPSHGIWGGLWSLPEYDGKQKLAAFCQKQYHCRIKKPDIGIPFRHTFTHFHLDITPVNAPVEQITNAPDNKRPVYWYNPHTPANLGLAAPVKKLLLKGLAKKT